MIAYNLLQNGPNTTVTQCQNKLDCRNKFDFSKELRVEWFISNKHVIYSCYCTKRSTLIQIHRVQKKLLIGPSAMAVLSNWFWQLLKSFF